MRRLALIALLACACTALAGLGLWQLGRAADKRARAESYAGRSREPALEFLALGRDADVAALRWRRVTVSGHYLDQHLLLDNRVHAGRAGYEVLTPFAASDGRFVLVDRGWIPLEGSRETVPEVIAPADPVAIRGHIGVEPTVGIDLGPEGDTAELLSPEIVRVQRIDLVALEPLVGVDLWSGVLYLDPGEAGALNVAWALPGDDSARHTAYAVQWFAMAAVLAGVGWWNLRRRRTRNV